jgi:hypothetical protein
MSAKAIETHYKGYRFRSRLEARWAVFFDTRARKAAEKARAARFEHGEKG